jgi:glycogen synthase
MDVFAFASQSETQGLVIAEAMAAGVPVVAVQAPGVEDLVQDGVNGRLLAQEDQAAFTQALVWVAALSQDKRAALKSNALKTVQEFSDTTCARKVLALFKTARREAKVLHEHESAWDEFMNIVSAEWNLVANLGRAAGKAWVEGGTEKPKEELT